MSEAQAVANCPVALSALPANFQKHVDPKAPAPLRMMGAKALVPTNGWPDRKFMLAVS